MIRSRSIRKTSLGQPSPTNYSVVDRAGTYPKAACISYYVDYFRRLRQAWRAGFSQGPQTTRSYGSAPC